MVNELPNIAVQGYNRERQVTFWNDASVKLYGYTAQEAMGRKLEDLIIPESLKGKVIDAIRTWFDNDVAMPSSERILRHKDGNHVSVYSSHVMQVTGQDEKTMYCVDIDLAELEQAKAREQTSRSFYRQLFDHSSSGVAVYEAIDNGRDFTFKDFNRAGEKIEKIRKDELLGRRVTEVFPGVAEFGLLDVFRRVWRTEVPEQYPLSYYQDGRLKGWRENRFYKLSTGEIVAVYDDMTQQKLLEEQQQTMARKLQQAKKMEAIGLMAGGVAHDLNNILSGITGYPELLLLQLPGESDLRKPLEAIKDSGERAAAVVADLLTVARGVASNRTVISLNTLVRVFLDSLECKKLRSQYLQVEYRLQFADNLPNISCSAVHINKCIMNLVKNAAEAMKESGTITLTTSSRVLEQQWARENGLEQGEYVVLEVADTGVGIPKENIEHIFEPFYTKKVMGRSGTGLGLAVVWNTLKEHDGTAIVRSNDQGTVFELFFPIAADDITQQELNAQGIPQGNGETVLIVDDEALLRDIARQMLARLGYSVDTVRSGESAIEFVKKKPIDLILIDMLMEPGMSGRQTYEEITKRYHGQKAVVASGFSESEDVKATLQLGAGGFIKKPYSMDQLGRVVKEVLNS